MPSGQKVAAAAKALGIVEQTLANWVKAEKAGQLRGIKSEQVSAERMENNRLRTELARVTMERGTSRRCSDEVRLDRAEQAALAGMRAVRKIRCDRWRSEEKTGSI